MPAARVHYSTEKNLVVVLSEMTIPVAASQDFADKMLAFAKSINAQYIVSIGGVAMKEGDNAVYVVSSDQKLAKNLLGKKGTRPIKEGATTGVTGVLLTKGVLDKYPVLSILAEASQDYLDPHAAANVLKVLSSFLNMPVDTTELENEAKEIGKIVKETAVKSKVPSKKLSSVHEESGSMFG
jgi:predicted ATP-grasp superfamily ATP-dependent carboligase